MGGNQAESGKFFQEQQNLFRVSPACLRIGNIKTRMDDQEEVAVNESRIQSVKPIFGQIKILVVGMEFYADKALVPDLVDVFDQVRVIGVKRRQRDDSFTSYLFGPLEDGGKLVDLGGDGADDRCRNATTVHGGQQPLDGTVGGGLHITGLFKGRHSPGCDRVWKGVGMKIYNRRVHQAMSFQPTWRMTKA